VFILAAPDGQVAGRAYKASAEASIFPGQALGSAGGAGYEGCR
jgi:hypothetical protein